MLVYLLIFFSLILPLVCVAVLLAGLRLPLRYSWHRLFVSLSLATLMYLYSTWVYISIYCKYIFGIAYIITLFLCLLRKKQFVQPMRRWRVVLNVSLGILFTVLCVLYF